MNEFTKEELIDIYNAVMETSVAMFEHLPAKIQSMIDNYPKPCNHNWMNMEYRYLQCEHCFDRKGFYE